MKSESVLVRLLNAENDDWVEMGSLSHREAALTLSKRHEYAGPVQTKNEYGKTIFNGHVEKEIRYEVSFYRGDDD